jgi:hypothetical protein
MTGVPDTGLARAIPEAGRSVRPRRALVEEAIGVCMYGILGASPLGGPSGNDGGLDWRLGGVRGGALTAAGGS